MNRIIKDADRQANESTSESLCLITDQFPSLETRIRMLKSDMADMMWTDRATTLHSPKPLRFGPSLEDVSWHFRRNFKQHVAFTLVGNAVLKSFIKKSQPDDQLIVFLDGLPGAGKSLVIKALQKLAEMWERSDAIAQWPIRVLLLKLQEGKPFINFLDGGIIPIRPNGSQLLSSWIRFTR